MRPRSVKRASVMREAVATTVSSDCDRRSRLSLMRLRASWAVRRLEARIAFAWVTSGPMGGIFSRIGELRMR